MFLGTEPAPTETVERAKVVEAAGMKLE